MAANGLLLTIAEYVGRGRVVKEILVDDKVNPTGATIVFDDGDTISWKMTREPSRGEFLKEWKQATVYLRDELIKVRSAGV